MRNTECKARDAGNKYLSAVYQREAFSVKLYYKTEPAFSDEAKAADNNQKRLSLVYFPAFSDRFPGFPEYTYQIYLPAFIKHTSRFCNFFSEKSVCSVETKRTVC
ncbi:MAG: hypothetical protein IIY77_03960 [Lachnospiraceae bacterium]|nr:hypothetical protein [Lachnospiraceae bacterium]